MNKLHAICKKTKQGYIGWIEEVPGVNTQGRTLVELKENLREAFTLILESNKILAKSLGRSVQRFPFEI